MIPLDEYFARWAHTPRVAERIAELSPNGIEEGIIPRGWNPTRTLRVACALMDLVSVKEFRNKWGEQPLLWLHYRKRLVNLGGKRRAVTYRDFKDPFH